MPHETLRGRNPKSESHKKPPTTSSFSLDETREFRNLIFRRRWLQASRLLLYAEQKEQRCFQKNMISCFIFRLRNWPDWCPPHFGQRRLYSHFLAFCWSLFVGLPVSVPNVPLEEDFFTLHPSELLLPPLKRPRFPSHEVRCEDCSPPVQNNKIFTMKGHNPSTQGDVGKYTYTILHR